MVRLPWTCLALLLFAALAGGAPLRAEQFVLANGGRIEGELLNPDQSPRTTYVVRTAAGGEVTLDKSQVRTVIARSEAERNYESILPRMPDTADGHWKMSEWCRESGLSRQRQFHVEEAIHRDPDHEDARRALGYFRLEGRWVRTEEQMEAQGYVLVGGSWRLRQVVELDKAAKDRDDAQIEWKKKLLMWKSWLGTRRHEQALAEFRAVRDPMAGPPLVELLEAEKSRPIRELYVNVLADVPGTTPVLALAKVALEDDDALRERALEILSRRENAAAVKAFIRELGNKENVIVNRAAAGLGRMKDPSAILPLIDALTTKHRVVVQSGSGPGQIGAGFGSRPGGGGGGISVGGGPKIVELEIPNPSVVDALIALADGANFQFDRAKWKDWYTNKNRPQVLNFRRDE
jgi:hypothetical protein